MTTRILIFGDSIAWGMNDWASGGWVNRLKVHYNANYAGMHVYNLGISGDTSKGVLERFKQEFGSRVREKMMAVLAIGINDSSMYFGTENTVVEFEQFKSNVKQIIAQMQEWADGVLVLGLTCVDEALTNPVGGHEPEIYTNASVRRFDAALKAEAEAADVQYVPLFDVLGKENLADGLHPGNDGHEKLFQHLNPIVLEASQNI